MRADYHRPSQAVSPITAPGSDEVSLLKPMNAPLALDNAIIGVNILFALWYQRVKVPKTVHIYMGGAPKLSLSCLKAVLTVLLSVTV